MIEVQDLSIEQGDFGLNGIDLTVPEGSYGVLMGPSGCGKSTVLEILCGLRRPKSGRVLLCGRDVTEMRPGERGVGYVPQDRALFPTMKIRAQLAFSLVIRRVSNDVIASRVVEIAELLGIGHLLDRLPGSLSGGEAQRVTLGRALANHPPVLCLDEPLSALDEDMHGEICELLADVHRRTGVTVLHVTHSVREADLLGSTVFRFRDGTVEERPSPGGEAKSATVS